MENKVRTERPDNMRTLYRFWAAERSRKEQAIAKHLIENDDTKEDKWLDRWRGEGLKWRGAIKIKKEKYRDEGLKMTTQPRERLQAWAEERVRNVHPLDIFEEPRDWYQEDAETSLMTRAR